MPNVQHRSYPDEGHAVKQVISRYTRPILLFLTLNIDVAKHSRQMVECVGDERITFIQDQDQRFGEDFTAKELI